MAFHPTVLAAALLLAAPAALPLAAHAQGADAQADACTPDTLRLCRGTRSNVAGTMSCLVAHKAQLSSTCRNVFAFAEPVVDRAPPASADLPRRHLASPHLARPHLAHLYRPHLYQPHRRVRYARRAIPYHIPRFDQAEAEAEVHAQYRYRTPYLPYWVFP